MRALEPKRTGTFQSSIYPPYSLINSSWGSDSKIDWAARFSFPVKRLRRASIRNFSGGHRALFSIAKLLQRLQIERAFDRCVG